MIDDDPLNNIQNNSPPPPAPNGEYSLVKCQQTSKQQALGASWNPFYTASMHQQFQQVNRMMIQLNLNIQYVSFIRSFFQATQASQPQLSSMNPFHADIMKQQVVYCIQFTYFAMNENKNKN